MTCPDVRALLHPYLDGELEADRRSAVASHLDGCAPCRERFTDEEHLGLRVRECLSAPCPESLRAKLLASLSAETPRRFTIESIEPEPAVAPALAPPAPAETGRVASPGEGRASPAHRARSLTWPRLVGAAAVVLVAFVVQDPLCLRGCPTVRALTREHARAEALPYTEGSPELRKAVEGVVSGQGELACGSRCGSLRCCGGGPLRCTDPALGSGVVLRYRDRAARPISLLCLRGASPLHPWLRSRRSDDGILVTRQDACSVAAWEDQGCLLALVASSETPLEEIKSLAASLRHK